MGTHDHRAKQSDLVLRAIPVVPPHSIIPFLLAAPCFTRSVALQARAFGTPPQCLSRAVVWLFHASDRTYRLHECAPDFSCRSRPSDPFHLFGLLAGAGDRHHSCRI